MQNKHLANIEEYADRQRRVRLAMLMAEAYRKRASWLEEENAKLASERPGLHNRPEKLNQENKIADKENRFIHRFLDSLEASLAKQSELVADLNAAVNRYKKLPQPSPLVPQTLPSIRYRELFLINALSFMLIAIVTLLRILRIR